LEREKDMNRGSIDQCEREKVEGDLWKIDSKLEPNIALPMGLLLAVLGH
jgi:hypothetical protein